MALGMGALLVNDIMKAALPLAIRSGIDSLMKGFRLSLVFEFAALVVLLSVVKGIFQYWMRVILIGLSRDIEFDLRNDLFSHIVTLSQDFYAKYRTGDIMARATNDLNAVRMMLGPGIMYFAETFFTAALLDWRDVASGLAADAVLPDPRSVGQRGGDPLRPPHSRSFRNHPEDVLRHQQPRSGESLGRARDSRLRAGGARDPEVRAAEPGLRGRKHRARQAVGAFHAAAAGPHRNRLPDRAVGRRLPVARAPHFARQFRDVQHLHGHADLAHDRARLGGESHAARHGLLEPDHGADATRSRASSAPQFLVFLVSLVFRSRADSGSTAWR